MVGERLLSCPVPAPSPIAAASAYHHHRPEQTALYAIVAEHYPRFVQEVERSGGYLPKFVRQEFDDCLKCGLLVNNSGVGPANNSGVGPAQPVEE